MWVFGREGNFRKRVGANKLDCGVFLPQKVRSATDVGGEQTKNAQKVHRSHLKKGMTVCSLHLGRTFM